MPKPRIFTIRDIPVDRDDGQYLVHVRVETSDDAPDHDVTILGLELPSGTLTYLGAGPLRRDEAEQVTLSAIDAVEEWYRADAEREPDWDAIRDARDGY